MVANDWHVPSFLDPIVHLSDLVRNIRLLVVQEHLLGLLVFSQLILRLHLGQHAVDGGHEHEWILIKVDCDAAHGVLLLLISKYRLVAASG